MDVDLPDLAALATWAYLVVGLLAAVDAVFPVVPSESLVVVGASLAARGDMDPWALLVAAALGAAVGDLTSFALGRQARRRWREPEDVRGRPGRALRWASDRLDADGERVIVTARFVPGGRTATTFAAGYLGHPVRRFARAAALGAVLWAVTGVSLGYIGGQVSDDPLVSVGGGIVLALTVTGALHVVRRRLGGEPAGPGEVGDADRSDPIGHRVPGEDQDRAVAARCCREPDLTPPRRRQSDQSSAGPQSATSASARSSSVSGRVASAASRRPLSNGQPGMVVWRTNPLPLGSCVVSSPHRGHVQPFASAVDVFMAHLSGRCRPPASVFAEVIRWCCEPREPAHGAVSAMRLVATSAGARHILTGGRGSSASSARSR